MFLDISFLNKQVKSFKNTRKGVLLLPEAHPRHRRNLNDHIQCLCADCHRNINQCKLLIAIVSLMFHPPCIITGHLEPKLLIYKENQVISASSSKPHKVWILRWRTHWCFQDPGFASVVTSNLVVKYSDLLFFSYKVKVNYHQHSLQIIRDLSWSIDILHYWCLNIFGI